MGRCGLGRGDQGRYSDQESRGKQFHPLPRGAGGDPVVPLVCGFVSQKAAKKDACTEAGNTGHKRRGSFAGVTFVTP